MKTKNFLTLLLLAVTTCLPAWADTTYSLIQADTINTKEFLSADLTLVDLTESVTVGDVTFTKGVQMAGTTANPTVNDQKLVIKYDAQTTATEVQFVAYNPSTTNDRTFRYSFIEEGGTYASGTNRVELTVKKGKNTGLQTYNSNSENHRSLFFHINNVDLKILAIKITEKGTPLTAVGTADYSLNFVGGRIVAKSGTAGYVDGIKIIQNQNYSAASTQFARLREDGNFIKFDVPADVKLTVTTNNTGVNNERYFFVGTQYKNWTPSTTCFKTLCPQESVETASSFEYTLSAGTWFVYPEIGKTFQFTSLSFTALAAKYDVKFIVDGDQVGETQKVTDGEYATAPATDPTKAGYKFKGWSTDGTEANIKTVASYAITENTDFTAVWEAATTHQVSFDSNGGSAVDPINVIEDEYITSAPTAPTKAGYAFQGWSETNGGDVVDITTIQITAPKTFYAVWDVAPYNIFSLTMVKASSVKMNSSTPERQLSPAGDENEDEDVTLVGGTAYIGCTDNNDRTVLNSNQIQMIGDKVYVKLILDDTVREGDIFKFTNTNNNTYQLCFTATPTRSTTYATESVNDVYQYVVGSTSDLIGRDVIYVWRSTPNTAYISTLTITRPNIEEHINTFVTLSFDTDGGNEVPSQKLLSGVWPTVEPAIPVKGTDIFQGWFDGDNLFAFGEPLSTTTTLLAKWVTPEVYTVRFFSQGAQIGTDMQVLENQVVTTPPADPERAGYDFSGWSTDGTFANIKNLETYLLQSDVDFYAVWTTKVFSLTIGTTTAKDMNNNEEVMTASEAMVEGGAGYIGCTENANKKVFGQNRIELGGDNAYIKLELNNDLREGDILKITGTHDYLLTYTRARNASIYTADLMYTIPAGSPLIGRQVLYLWRYDNSQNGIINKIKILRPENTVPNEFVYLSFNADGGSAVQQQKLLKNVWPTEAPAVPVNNYKIFLGWFLGDDEFTFGNPLAENVTLLAKWRDPVEYTIRFYSQGEPMGDAFEFYENQPVPAANIPADPQRDGYNFSGWSTDGTSANIKNLETYLLHSNVDFTAVWTTNVFTLTVGTTAATNMKNDERAMTNDEATVVGGAGYIGCTENANKKVFGQHRIELGGDNAYIKLELNNDLREGDILKITGTHDYLLTYTRARNAAIYTTDRTYTIPAGSPLIGREVLYLWRYNNTASGVITAINVDRPENTVPNEFVYLSFNADGGSAVQQQKLLKNVWPTEAPAVPVNNYKIFLGWFLGDDEFTFGNPLAENVTLLAKWRNPAEYTIRFYSQDEPMGDEFNCYENQPVPAANIPADPQREGYNFKGWSTDGTDANIKNLETYLLQSEVNFYAVWHKVINVTTDIQGVQTIVPYEENDYANLSSPTRNGYHFAGWKKSGEADLYDFSTPLTEDITLVAQWTEADPNVFTFANNDIIHFDGFSYKSPEGAAFVREIVNNVLEDERALTNNPYTMFESDGGITSIVVNGGYFNPRARTDYDIAFVSPQIKLKTTSNMVFTVKDGYEATLNITASGYDNSRTIHITGATPAEDVTEGRADWNTSGEMTFYFGAGTHTLTVAAYTLFVKSFTLTTTYRPHNLKLSDLRVNGVTIDGYSPLVDEYNAFIPYTATNIPAVTYTASDPANVTISECWYPVGTDAMDYVVTVTSKVDPTQSRDYTIHFTPGAKDKLVLVRGDYVSDHKRTVTGKFKDETKTTMNAQIGDFNGGYRFGVDYTQKIHLAITGETFHEGDLLRVFITKKRENGGSTLTVYGDANGTEVIYASGVVGEVGLNTIALPAAVEGKTDLYLMRVTGNTWNPYIRYAEVVRTLDEPVITSFTVADQEGVIDQTNKTINVELPPYTSYVQTPVITTQNNGQTFETLVTPTGEQDFSTPVTYTLTDKDGDTNTYTVNVTTLIEIGNDDNSALLSYYNGKNVNVNFTRPIDATNGDWYTLCLPFNMSAEQIEAAFGPCQLATLATSEWLPEANLARIRHSYVTAIEAGKPYLFLPENSISGDVTIPGVTIDNTERPVTTTYVDFIGTFNPKHLDDDGYTFYLDDNNMLYHPWENMTLRATRCYYHFHNLTPAQMQNIMARVMIDGDANHTPTTIGEVSSNDNAPAKLIRDGQLIIIRDGIEYTALGAQIK